MSGRGRESTRQFRARFAGCLPIEISRSKWARDRRLGRGRFKRTRGALGVRSYQALNLLGVRIWVDKPRLFGGKLWRARRATVAAYLPAPFSARRGLYVPGLDRLCMTGVAFEFWGDMWRAFDAPLHAPEVMAAGGCRNLEPFWCPGDPAPQITIAREPWR